MSTPIPSLFALPVVAGVASEAMWAAPVHPDEEPFVARAVTARRREFAAGRSCARDLLAGLGLGGAIPVGPGGAPRWPSGAVGSISHCPGLCAAAVAPADAVRGVGLDVEMVRPLEPAMIRRICRVEELSALVNGSRSIPEWASIIFSAKEAFYKCYYPLTGQFLEYGDVRIRLQPAWSRFDVELLSDSHPDVLGRRPLRGRFAVWDGFVACAVTLPTTAPVRVHEPGPR
jgi:4'-phosphopantetheinyl transferase EntD